MRGGISRHEFEYEIPTDEAGEILHTLCTGPVLEKLRYICRTLDQPGQSTCILGRSPGSHSLRSNLPIRSSTYLFHPGSERR